MRKLDALILSVILVIALLFRLYKINIPLADLHSWRQADTAAVARNYVKNGIDLFHPIYDDFSNVQSGIDNPNGYRMVEFPIYNAIIAFFYKSFPIFTLEIWGRLTTVIFSLIVISVIYYLLLNESNRLSAIFGSLTYAIFPFFVFFSRVILPETTTLAFTLLAILSLYINSKLKERSIKSICLYFLSAILFAVSLLIKPTIIFYFFPIIVIFFRKNKLNLLKKLDFYLYFIIALVPLVFWRSYIKNFPEGIPYSDWLFTSANTAQGLKSILFRPSFFRWIFFERINNLILGGYLTLFFVLGTIAKQKKYLLISFLVSALAYILVFQGGNLQHEYYQTLILPVFSMMIGLGVSFVFGHKKEFISSFFVSILVFVIFISSFYFSYFKVIDYYVVSQELVQEANIINSLTSPEDKIVTDRTGDTTLLYLANRRGAPSIFRDPIELKKLGYKYLITSNEGEINIMKPDFQIVFENEKFTLFKL
ncbi:MAG: dolichyl-phosphate-mannose-protein mannosyltransferase [uncultured bacterium]|nr:MAG: dolichyl-phosphate-mannose-protein mannosyltransferase [uncultured bacterium]